MLYVLRRPLSKCNNFKQFDFSKVFDDFSISYSSVAHLTTLISCIVRDGPVGVFFKGWVPQNHKIVPFYNFLQQTLPYFLLNFVFLY